MLGSVNFILRDDKIEFFYIMLIRLELSQKRVYKNDGMRFRVVVFFIDRSEDKLHGTTLPFMLSTWDVMLEATEKTWKVLNWELHDQTYRVLAELQEWVFMVKII